MANFLIGSDHFLLRPPSCESCAGDEQLTQGSMCITSPPFSSFPPPIPSHPPPPHPQTSLYPDEKSKEEKVRWKLYGKFFGSSIPCPERYSSPYFLSPSLSPHPIENSLFPFLVKNQESSEISVPSSRTPPPRIKVSALSHQITLVETPSSCLKFMSLCHPFVGARGKHDFFVVDLYLWM